MINYNDNKIIIIYFRPPQLKSSKTTIFHDSKSAISNHSKNFKTPINSMLFLSRITITTFFK